MNPLRVSGVVVSLLLPLALLSGCGEGETTAADPASGTSSEATSEPPSVPPSPDGPPDPSVSASPSDAPLPDWPACAEIWQDGKTLPGSYVGCLDGDAPVAAKGRECAFGRPLITYANAFYAIPDARVNATAGAVSDDPEYQASLSSCQG